jgi:hypothetical protein
MHNVQDFGALPSEQDVSESIRLAMGVALSGQLAHGKRLRHSRKWWNI